ncbi:peptide ABC transporter substrate-binding protein [Haloactinopolyspora sp.]|uniref:peptide ABC transporter substrate-binding protein n=1 Tax=Haloactinopolyspora sp. TaxID=1966353 RepID=UPI002623FBE1|nr:peptide ABC transporter substrate-binding protein [Haloactinopolyspora sp.]
MARPVTNRLQPWPGVSRREFLRVSGLVGLAAGGGWALAGCGLSGDDDPAGGGGGEGGSKVLRMTFVPVEVLDPQIITNGMWILTRGILEGLVMQNDDGTDVVPAVAESWDISEDQLTYTFHIRADAKWSNGDPVTAGDFERTYQRLFTPSSGGAGGTTLGQNAYQSTTGIKGAVEYLNGATEDWSEVGVVASSDSELVLTLATPNPDFLLALTHPSLLPLHMDTVEQMPDEWQVPPNFVANGPYAVDDFVPNSSLSLVPNEEYWDRDNVSLDAIEITQVDPGAAAGTLTVPYENNETDILQLSEADVSRFQDDPELSEHLQAMETYSVGYLARLRSKHPALDDVRVRKALSISLDRQQIASVVPGAEPGLSLPHDHVAGWDERLVVEENLDEAKQLLADAGYPDGQGLPQVRILQGVDSPIVDAVIDQWNNRLGIDALNDRVEAGVYVERRWAVQDEDYIGFYWGTFAGLPTMPTYVGALWSPLDIQKFSLPGEIWGQYLQIEADSEMDPAKQAEQLNTLLSEHSSEGSRQMAELVSAAKAELDEEQRKEMYLQAARIREDEYLYFAVSWLSVFFAVRPSVSGLQLRRYPDFFYLKSLGLEA